MFIDCESNTHGTLILDGDGLNCIAKCSPGYTGNRCEYCAIGFYVSNGANGTFDMSNEVGPKCKGITESSSKFVLDHKITHFLIKTDWKNDAIISR